MNPYAQPQQQQNAGLQQQMLTWFNYVDKDRSGQVDAQELQMALQQAGLRFSMMSTNMLLRLFDANKQGTMTYQEFCNMYGWVQQKQVSFYHFDRDRSGSLDMQETHQALTHAGYNLDQHAFYAAVRVYDPDHNGVMSMTEYVGLCAYLQIATNTFASFDTQRSGNVSFNLNQFIYATSQCK
eukprot:TRINITY_DN4217_c0_g1_i1.p1 TRINITY_DN4217_c0_g1~~TRINITY_DN4217_c0_g1_i1.p1  ORF type:complete len:189 (+),score=28.86 TRINITY_DN4217_c0_g1_i1:23-568(+)